MRSFLKIVLLTAVALQLALSPLRAAELKLAAIFSDHMVLQSQKPLPIWGWADPKERVAVNFAGQEIVATADARGKWLVKLNPLPASAESRTLVVQSESPERKIEVADVLVGEVWLGSGQSNMVLPVEAARDFEKEKANANSPSIRMFKVENASAIIPQEDFKGQWLVCSPETVGSYSATLFFFGRELDTNLGVPVGLINSSVNSSPIESWVSAKSQIPTMKMKAGNVEKPRDGEAALAIPSKPVNPTKWRALRDAPGGLFNGMIAPLIPFALRGVVWYQGERNTRQGYGSRYQYQLPLLVNDWRSRWDEEFPFGWVQLPNYKPAGEDWMLVREAQLKSLRLPNTGMAITVDIGESSNVHPKNKQDVGKRLALWALGEVYGQTVTATSGPLPKAHQIHGSEIVVSFIHTDGGLLAGGGVLTGFSIAGKDRQWKTAQAHIEGEQVVVSSLEVKKPIAVRYAWEPDPQCNLFNGVGLPASPFRTDDWATEASHTNNE